MSGTHPLVEVRDAARWFDVSPPWLERKLSGKPAVMLRAVDGVSFDIARGETLALVGESGCGKSTVARMLVGLYGLTRGDIRFDGCAPGRHGRIRRPGHAQAPADDLPGSVCQPESALARGPHHRRAHADPHHHDAGRAHGARGPAAQAGGLDPADQGRYPHQFSGGQRQRISIARALAVNPSSWSATSRPRRWTCRCRRRC